MPNPRLAVIAGLAAVAACAGGDRDLADHAPDIDTLAGGLIRVVNTGPTLWADTSGWRLVEERVVQPAEGTPGEFSDVTKLVADDAGNVYVMQIMPTVIKAFDREGNWLRNIGRQGNGPGEFPDGMLGIHGDTLIVQDPNNQRLTTFLTDGTLLRTTPSQCCAFTPSLPVLADGTVMIMGPAPTGAENARWAYYRTRLDGTVIDTLPRPIAPGADRRNTMWSVQRTVDGKTSSVDIGIPGLPRDESAWRNDGMLVSGNSARYVLAVRREFRDTVRIIESTAPQLQRTDAERDSMLERAIADQGPAWRDAIRAVANVAQIPRDRPVWSSLATDREGRVWVGVPGPGSAVATLEVFSPEGVLLGRLPAPHPRILDGYWTRDRVYLIDTDAEDRPLVRIYRLESSVR